MFPKVENTAPRASEGRSLAETHFGDARRTFGTIPAPLPLDASFQSINCVYTHYAFPMFQRRDCTYLDAYSSPI